MKALRRNKQKIYYANRIGSSELTDEFGDGTGEMLPEYTEAKPIYCNVSASRGIADSEIFGINLDYTKTLTFGTSNVPITEESVLWIGKKPDAEWTVKYNYVVKAIAQSLNFTVIAVKEVKVS